MCPYECVPLNNSTEEVRLLTLLPGAFGQNIEAKLSTTPLILGYVPEYKALSYCWGPSKDPQTITVNGESLAVTQSLATDLPYLRLPDRVRVLWIDAICVNQSDLLERSLQVERMADVYSYAHRQPISIKPTDHSLGDVTSLPFWGKDVLDAIRELLNIAWFERLWIWQEIRLSNESSILVWGNNQILWRNFRDAILCLEWKKVHRLYPDSLSLATRFQTIVSIANKFDFMSFNTLLSVSRNSKCSDPRDRIYAILSLAKNYTNGYEPTLDVKPDYTKGAADIYKEVTVQNLTQLKTLKFLTHCELNEDGIDVPSWVPDWSTQRETFKLSFVKASGDSFLETWTQSDGTLEVQIVLYILPVMEAC
ncbi:hypothetical protein G7Y89_g12209 [Cudoniella acicularis]|uniref:Heterokaryon incompatibility domain-containing protein n=1 Tax=Cudoniella acicularis TaxID=354080 RepID=A0A8H4R9H3_9HELO|nr:hypothetical protein G7Y89_g12209 [Cudoniella acicularis]